MSYGEGGFTPLDTIRGRDYPALTQFTVFLENRVGQLMEVIRRFDGTNVRILALSINDSTECAVARFLLSNPETGREILERSGFPLIESQLVALELPDTAQPMLTVCTALLRAELNISQAYPLFSRPHGRPVVALMVDNIERAVETLTECGFQMITEDDLIFDV
ncbi:MAG: acetolactate synthase [Planctomycetota bacterium]|nr:acetolactate synthase [Planctomycetota bacterium]